VRTIIDVKTGTQRGTAMTGARTRIAAMHMTPPTHLRPQAAVIVAHPVARTKGIMQ